MTLILIALFVIAPIAEIYVLLAAGGTFGILPVILACLGTAVLGGILLRIQGLAAANQARESLSRGEAPVGPMVDGLFLAMAAPFLMTPGFLTDMLGFSLLVPPFRHFLAQKAAAWFARKFQDGPPTIVIKRR